MNRSILFLLSATTLLLAAGPALAAADGDGFIYGKVTTAGGHQHTGFLRWGDEEAFWDDLFHSAKEDLPYFDEVDPDELEAGLEREHEDIIDVIIDMFSDHGDPSRVFSCRYGDIRSLEVLGGDSAEVRLKSGLVLEVEGYSNDVGGTIHVTDDEGRTTDLKWRRIDTIEFLPAPAGARPPGHRLHGTVETRRGSFTGFIQWDKSECLDSDILDGESDGENFDLRMGDIARIERRNRNSCTVTMHDGEQIRLRGTNDVDDSNRGIMVEDPRFGRVTVPWDEFESLDLDTDAGSGRGYDSFVDGGPLRGEVRCTDGRRLSGRLVYDLDESETWEQLNGAERDLEYDIPFALIERLEREGESRCRVHLHGGGELLLDEGHDIGRENAGVLVYESEEATPVYLPWRDVEVLAFRR